MSPTAPMTQDDLKALVGRAVLDHIPDGAVVGVGTGSTVNQFIDALATRRDRIAGAVSSSEASTARLRSHGIRVLETQDVTSIPVYIDGADEIDPRGHMIKGGGAALTREKIVADLAERFICICDESKRVAVLGAFPLPVEVVPLAVPRLVRRFAALGGQAAVRPGVTTDNGQCVLDVRGLTITDPLALEAEISLWPGVLTVGIFARHRASLCLLGTPGGVVTLDFS